MILQHTHTPLSYKEWKNHYEDSFDASELPLLYNNYLTEWKKEKLERQTKKDNYVKDVYAQFLKNINLSTIDKQVVIFLDRINTNNIYELELAVHYYTVIIKDQLKNQKTYKEVIVDGQKYFIKLENKEK